MNKKLWITVSVIVLLLIFVLSSVFFVKRKLDTTPIKPGADKIATQSIAIVYHPYNEGIKQVARIIESRVGGDVYLLEPFSEYPMSEELKKGRIVDEQNHPDKIQLKNSDFNFKKYNIIFIGAPVIYGNISPLVMRFVMDYGSILKKDKIIIPFVFYSAPDLTKETYVFLYQYLNGPGYKGGYTSQLLNKSANEMYIDLWFADMNFKKSELSRPDKTKAKVYKNAVKMKKDKVRQAKEIQKAIKRNQRHTGQKQPLKPKYRGYGD